MGRIAVANAGAFGVDHVFGCDLLDASRSIIQQNFDGVTWFSDVRQLDFNAPAVGGLVLPFGWEWEGWGSRGGGAGTEWRCSLAF